MLPPLAPSLLLPHSGSCRLSLETLRPLSSASPSCPMAQTPATPGTFPGLTHKMPFLYGTQKMLCLSFSSTCLSFYSFIYHSTTFLEVTHWPRCCAGLWKHGRNRAWSPCPGEHVDMGSTWVQCCHHINATRARKGAVRDALRACTQL